MDDNSWAQVILRQDPRRAATVGLLMDMAHKVLGSGSEHGPVADLWEPEDPYIPKQMRVYQPPAKRDGEGAIRQPRPPPLPFCSVVNLELNCNQAMI